MKFALKYKDQITSACGLVGGIAWSGLTVIQAFSIAVPEKTSVVLGAVSAVCFGVIGWFIGKKAESEK